MLRILLFLLLVVPGLFQEVEYKIPSCTPPPESGNSNYVGIAFDFYATLVDPLTTITTRAKAPNLPKGFVDEWYRRVVRYTWLRDDMGRYRDFRRVVSDALDWTLDVYKKKLNSKQKKSLVNSWIQRKPYPGIKTALKKIRKSNPNLYVISNETPEMLAKGLKYAGLSSFFKKVISVDAVKAYKPNPRVYEYLVQSTCIPKEKLLVVSGKSWEAQGSKSYGFPTVWINREGLPMERLGFPVGGTFKSLTQLIQTVATSNGCGLRSGSCCGGFGRSGRGYRGCGVKKNESETI